MYSFGHLRFCCILRRIGASVVRAPLWVEPVDGDGGGGNLSTPCYLLPWHGPSLSPSAGGITFTEEGENIVKYKLCGTTNWSSSGSRLCKATRSVFSQKHWWAICLKIHGWAMGGGTEGVRQLTWWGW